MPAACYPLFLDLSAAACLVVGAGAVGRRKTDGLLAAGVRHVLVLDPNPPVPSALPEHAALTFAARAFTPEDLRGRALVFACSNKREVNAAVAAACAAAGVFCNSADAPLEGNFFVPATARAGELVLALSTGGASPAYARFLREELEKWLAGKAPLAGVLGRIRSPLLALGLDTGQNAKMLRALVRSDLGTALAAGDGQRCAELLTSLLPHSLHPRIPEFLEGAFSTCAHYSRSCADEV